MIPLKHLLDTAPDEHAMRTGWDAIAARLPRAPRVPDASAVRDVRGTRSPARWLVLAGAAAAIAIAVIAWPRLGAPPGAALLALADGRPLPPELTADTRLSDGSQIAISRGQLEILETDDQTVRWLLATGTARFAIQPGGPRRWTIDAGVAQIEVIGTVFTVARSAGGVEVSVERGIVVVRGDRVPGLVRRLQAGQSLHIAAAITASTAPPSPPSPPSPPPSLPGASPVSTAPAIAAPAAATDQPRTPSSPSHASAAPPGAHTPPRASIDAVSASPPVPSPAEAPRVTAEALLARADELRRHGDLAGAAAVLGQIPDTQGDPLNGIARFTRARILIELGRHQDAAADLRRAITVGLPPALEARARARLAQLTATGATP